MDSLTQIVLGAAVADRIGGSKISNRSFIYGAIIATIPDLDVVLGKWMDPIDALTLHRGWSHSILFFILLSLILSIPIHFIEKRNGMSYQKVLMMVFLCLFTHSLLDAFTSWGTQLFWPLEYRVALKSIFVVDPLYTIPLIITLVMAFRIKKNDDYRKKWINRGFYISTGYLVLALCMKTFILYHFKNDLQEKNIKYQDIIIKPSPMNIILWHCNVKLNDGFLLADYSLLDKSSIMYDFYKNNAYIDSDIINLPKVQQLISISEGWYTIDKTNDGWIFNDLRFGLLYPYSDEYPKSFIFSYHISLQDDKYTLQPVDNKDRKSGLLMMQQLLKRIQGQ